MADDWTSAQFGVAQFGRARYNTILERYSIDTILSKLTQPTTSKVDALLKRAIYKNIKLDTYLDKSRQLTQLYDTLTELGIEKDIVFDIIIGSESSSSHYLDTYLILHLGKSKVMGVDALLKAQQALSVSVDTLVKSLGTTRTHMIDIIMSEINEKNILEDILLSKEGKTTYSTNANLSFADKDIRMFVDALIEGKVSTNVLFDTELTPPGLFHEYEVDTLISKIVPMSYRLGLNVSKDVSIGSAFDLFLWKYVFIDTANLVYSPILSTSVSYSAAR